MLTTLHNLPVGVWVLVILVIIIASAIVIWMRKRRFNITKIKLRAGPVEAELTPASPDKPGAGATPPTAPPPQPASINIRGNKFLGCNILRIRRQGTNVEDNLIAGKNEIDVGDKPGPKPKNQGRKPER